MIPPTLALLLALLPPALSHFTLDSPPARGFNEDQLSQFPCGGQNSPSTRTLLPLPPFPIQLTMGHDTAAVQVLLALGNDPGSDYNLTLLPTIQEVGLGKFCLGAVGMGVGMGMDLGIKEGVNATVQVVTSGDGGGGLYNCADVTFSAAAQPGSCTNGTGVKAVPYTGKAANANGTSSGGPGATPSGGAAATGSTAPKSSAAGERGKMGWGVVVGGVLVGAAAVVLV